MSTFPILFDPDRWIRVPTDWASETQWPDAEAWAHWIADELTREREHGAAIRPAVQEEALAVAAFPSEHVAARFWCFPVDGEPNGWADVHVQYRVHDGTDVAELLPPAGETVVEPVLVELEDTAFERAVRRLSLVPLGEAELGAGGSGVLAKGEWLSTGGDWVVYVRSVDADARALTRRLADIDRLLSGVDPAALAGVLAQDRR